MDTDYEKLGLKIGLELHQQLNTRKLFCNCSTEMKEQKQKIEIRRRLRPVVGEMGKIDQAAIFEFLRKREFIYRGYQNEFCLVDTDDEPPHNANAEALKIALGLAIMLKMHIPDEIHIMRKTVLDGSAITSFQRTMLVGYGNSKFNGVRVRSLCLEEDASKPQENRGDVVVYSLSRLGIPLIELATEPDIKTPQQCLEIAQELGMLFRSFNVKRGIGTIRQDVNVSIAEGARVEIKGWQDLKSIKDLIENEVQRQSSLVEIKKLLEKMPRQNGPIDVCDIFGFESYAMKLSGFRKLLEKDICFCKTLKQELLEYPKAYGAEAVDCDEKYDKEFQKIHKILEPSENDALIVIFKGDAKKAALALEARINQLYAGVPEETRKPNSNATSSFSRPLPGSERMYPETDCLPVIVTKDMLEKIEKSLPKTLGEKLMELEKIMPKEIASQLIRSRYFQLFEELEKKIKDKDALMTIATTFTATLKDMSRNNIDIEKIADDDFEKIFLALEKGKITSKAIPEILAKVVEGEECHSAIKSFVTMDEGELEKIISQIVKDNSGLNQSALMGIVMKELKGKADGRKVMEIVKKIKDSNQ